MVSLHPDHELDRIAAGLVRGGALALILIEAGDLERIERRYGGEAHRTALDGLRQLAAEIAGEIVPREDVLVTEERARGAILAFLFRPRSDQQFYGSKVRRLAARVAAEMAVRGHRVVYPYHRETLELPTGLSVLLHNPTVNPERQILQAVEDARQDARLEANLARRQRGRDVLDLLLARELQIRYEPIVDLQSVMVLGYEALSRGPEGSGMENPRHLFRMAEEAGLLFELDCLCRHMAMEGAAGLPSGRNLFLNCLPTAIGDPNLRDEGLRKILEHHNIRPGELVLEISENESIENFGIFQEVRDSCRDLGIRIAIDDAGTGYASLEAIMEISPDFIKTDVGLVHGIDSDKPRQEVVRAMNSVARGIGATVIAEGVETDGELRVLREIGIHYGQGYYFGSALSARPEGPDRED